MTGSARVALANIRPATDPEDAVDAVCLWVAAAGKAHALVVCFPEMYVPGYPWPDVQPPPLDAAYLEDAWARVADAAGRSGVAVVLGTERMVDDERRITALVLDRDGSRLGFQDKVQLDPSEDLAYRAGAGRRLFTVGDLRFGVVICHEGWRYPETVRSAAVAGAHVVFHPHFHPASPGDHHPAVFGDPRSSFHEAAMRCRAAENTVFFASVNIAGDDAPTTSAVIGPDGEVVAAQPRGTEGLLVVDLELGAATGLLAKRLRPSEQLPG
ncbi:MAG: carbon-nitrogen hydrolase family protein [Thermoleophilia bacterium]